jgi:hypothetical protein
MAEPRNENEIFFTALFEGKRGKDWQVSSRNNYFRRKYVKNEGDTYILNVPTSATETGVFKGTGISFMFNSEPVSPPERADAYMDDRHQTYLFKFKDTAAIVDIIIHDIKDDKDRGISIEMRPRNGKSKKLVLIAEKNGELMILAGPKTDDSFTNQGNKGGGNFMQITKNLKKSLDYPFRFLRVENNLTRVQAINAINMNTNLAENTEKIPKRKTLEVSKEKKEAEVYVNPPKKRERNCY